MRQRGPNVSLAIRMIKSSFRGPREAREPGIHHPGRRCSPAVPHRTDTEYGSPLSAGRQPWENLRARNAPALLGLGRDLRAAARIDSLVGMIHRLQTELPRAQIGLEVGGRERLGIKGALRLFALLVEQERGLC